MARVVGVRRRVFRVDGRVGIVGIHRGLRGMDLALALLALERGQVIFLVAAVACGGRVRAGVVHSALLHHLIRRAEFRGDGFALIAPLDRHMAGAGRRGRRAGGHQDLPHAAAADIGSAQIRGEVAAVHADRHPGHAAVGRGEALIGQVRVYLAHDLAEELGRGVAGGVDLDVLLIAGPHRRHIIRRVANEIAVVVIGGGTGLAGHGHTREAGAAAGTGGDDLAQIVVHEIGRDLVHSLPGIGSVVQDHVAVLVSDLRIGAGLVINTVVGEDRIGRRHLHRADAAGQAAQTQRGGVHVVAVRVVLRRNQGRKTQLFRHEIVGFLDAQRLHHADGAGVQRFGDGRVDAHQTIVIRVGVHRPGPAVQGADRRVIEDGGRRDHPRVQRGRVRGNGLDGTAALALGCGVVEQAAALLFAHAAGHGHDIARVGIDDRDGGLHLVALGGIRQVVAVFINLVHAGLDLQVLGAVNVQAAVIDHLGGHFLGVALFHLQILDHVVDHLVDEPGIILRVVLIVRAVGEDQLLGHGLVVLLLGDLALVIHLVKDGVLTLQIVLQRRFRIIGIVQRGIVGDADQIGALGQRQLGHVLAEIDLRRRFDAVAPMAQVDIVEIQFHDIFLGMGLFKIKGAEDLRDLALDGAFLVAGDVLDRLLCQGGTAEGVVRIMDKQVNDGRGRAPPVHAVVLQKAFVLDGDGRQGQIFRHGVVIGPDTVLAAVQRFQFLPLAFAVFIENHGALGHGDLGNIHMGVRNDTGRDINRKDPGKNNAGADEDQEQRFDDKTDRQPPFLPGVPALPVRCILTAPA